jgi:hypothetical protein
MGVFPARTLTRPLCKGQQAILTSALLKLLVEKRPNSAFCPRVKNGLLVIVRETAIVSQNSINQLVFVMVKCCVFFAVGTEFLRII